MQETILLERKDLRQQAIERIEVLNKVKELFLIPKMEVMTIKQVADYFEASIDVIKKCYSNNKNEIDSDGTALKSYKDFLKGNDFPLETQKGKTIIKLSDSMALEIPNRGIRCFSQRAILRIGMLLRDSPIAQEIRTQLLNTFENSTATQRTEFINEELELQKQIGLAIMSGDILQMNEAYTKAFAFKNRHIAQLQEANTELTDNNKALAGELLQWNDRACINKAVRVIAAKCKTNFAYIWKELYDELLYKHGIGLSQRGKPPFIQHIKENEWSKVQQSLAAICENRGISFSKVVEESKIKI